MADAKPATLDFTTLDVFTQTRFSGNQLAVVWNADALTTEQMQAIAAEFGYSETTFVLRPTQREFHAHVRIFTPSFELPFAGHPTIGTAIALAERLSLEGTVGVNLQLAAGPIHAELEGQSGAVQATFAPPVQPHLLNQHQVDLAPLVGIEEVRTLSCASAGTAFAFVELASMSSVDACSIQAGFAPFIAERGVVGLFLYAHQDEDHLYARMFAPEAGVPEDPATGSAAAALAAVLWAERPVKADYLIHQGVKMGRPSQMGLSLAPARDGKLGIALIKGHAVKVMTGQIEV